MRKYHVTAFFLLLSLLLASCGQNGGTTTTTDTSISEATGDAQTTPAASSKDRLGSYDFGGATYTILGRDYAKLGNLPSYEFTTDAENGDLINDTIYKRNRLVEEQYHVVIESIQAPAGQSVSLVEKSQMAGDGAYDLVWAHVSDMSTLVLKQQLSDYHAIPVIDLTKPWWNQLATDSMTVNGRCYLQMNYIPFTGVMLSHCLYYNKALAAEYQIGDLYDRVRADAWDFDTFAAMVKRVSGDLDGNSVYDEKDRYGLAASHGTSGAAFSIAMGTKPVQVHTDGSFDLILMSDRNQNILEKIVSLTTDQSVYLLCDYSRENELAKLFAEGRALFYSGFLTDSYQFFRDMKDDFGLLPFPKYDSDQENYITTVTGGTGLLSIPKYVTDPEKVGVITEALAIESYQSVYPAIYETVFEEKLLRDEDSKEMFDLLMSGLEIDFGRTFKYADYSDILPNLVAKGSTDLSSATASTEKAARKHYEAIIGIFYGDTGE